MPWMREEEDLVEGEAQRNLGQLKVKNERKRMQGRIRGRGKRRDG